MAQVYSFTDQNGETRLFAEIHPDPAGTPFNGGTITGALTIDPTDTTAVALEIDAGVGQTGDLLDLFGLHQTTEVTAVGGVSIVASATPGIDDMIVIGFPSSLTTNVLNVFQNFAPFATLFKVSKSGYLMFATHSAPADAEVGTGECSLWFDQTNGAAKLMVKAKQADGTVKTAAVALS